MAFKSTWITTCFDNGNSNQMRHNDKKDTTVTMGSNIQSTTYTHTKTRCVVRDWLKEYAPTIPSNLVVRKPKLDEINEWLQETSKTVGKAPILLITGPSGVGKYTSLKVLATAQNFQLIEWETPMDINNSELDGSINFIQSQASKFEAFLLSSGRYTSVFGSKIEAKKLIIVKELPNVFTLQPKLLLDILRRYHAMGRVPIVFSFLEQAEARRQLFSKEFLEELNIHQISFNKVTDRSILKALRGICQLRRENIISDDVLMKIVENVNGDLRNAILQLSYEFVQDGGHESAEQYLLLSKKVVFKQKSNAAKIFCSRGSKRKKSSEPHKEECTPMKVSQALEARGKDKQVPFFQRIGRLLYPKQSEKDAAFLVHDPEEVVNQTIAHPRLLLNMVFENYLKVFSNASDVHRAIRYTSDADAMLSEFRERELIIPMALSTVVRGFMTCNITSNRRWTPLTNQEFNRARQRIEAVRMKIMDTDPKYILVPRAAAMDIFPHINLRFSTKLDSIQCSDQTCNASDDENELECPGDDSKQPQHSHCRTMNSMSKIQALSVESSTMKNLHTRNLKDDDDAAYEIQESDSDGETNTSDACLNDDIDFFQNLQHI